jgi:cell wall-associated NlpC family hydrolase
VRLSIAWRAALIGSISVGASFASASAATVGPPVGQLMSVVQNTFTSRLHVTGWAYDPARAYASVSVRVYVDGTYVTTARADHPSPNVDAARHISGRHRFDASVAWRPRAARVVVRTKGVRAGAPLLAVASRSVSHYYPPPGARIIAVARTKVGAPYVSGGAGPSGFDCSGYTKYSYGQARVAALVHSADGQRRHARRIAPTDARPGDLVFYLSGGIAYHVAVYAGHGWQYAATTPAGGVRYQPVWSRAVVYGTTWH